MAVKIFAVGDIAGDPNENPGAEATGKLIAKLLAAEPEARVLVIGDTAYLDGTPEEFAEFYKDTWGGVLEKTHPCPGNHEYHSGAVGYFEFFGKRAGSQKPRNGVAAAFDEHPTESALGQRVQHLAGRKAVVVPGQSEGLHLAVRFVAGSGRLAVKSDHS